MESFEYYLKNKLVRKESKNLERARALVNDAFQRIQDVNSINIEKVPKLAFEHTYDALRDFCDAVLIAEGFKSYSHEASIVYLSKKGFGLDKVMQLDNFRFKRNGSKYYGHKVGIAQVREILEFYKLNEESFRQIFKVLNII
jgi:hypothetical protein